MSDQQRYSEEEVQSILRDAIRRPSFEAEKGFSREDIQRFAAEAGISEQAVEQSLSKHKGRRRAKLLEHSRKTAVTLDWELSDREIDSIAELCDVLPPYAYKLMGNFATIRIDRWGFYCMVSVLRKDGYTQIELDRGANLEFLLGMSLFLLPPGLLLFFSVVPVMPGATVLLLSCTVVLVVLGCIATLAAKRSRLLRKQLANEIVSELGARYVDHA